MLVNIASSDAFVLGLLSSRIHVTWALAAGGTLEDRPRYNKTRCFEPFPFPDPTQPQRERIRFLGERLDAHRKCIRHNCQPTRNRGLHAPELGGQTMALTLGGTVSVSHAPAPNYRVNTTGVNRAHRDTLGASASLTRGSMLPKRRSGKCTVRS